MRNTSRTRQRVATTVCVAAVSVVVAGCGSSGGSSPSAPKASTNSTGGRHASAGTTVSFIVGVSGSPFYEAMVCGAKSEAKQLGVTLKEAAPSQFAPAQQVPIVDAAISSHPKAMVLVPTDPNGLNGAAEQAISAGIKLVTADQTLSDTKGVSTQVLSNNVAGGKQVAAEMDHELNGHGKIVVLTTEPGQVTSQDQRAQGFIQALKKYPGLTYVGAQYSNDQPSVTASQVDSELSRYPDLAGIFATNDQGGIGAASALSAAHEAGKVKLFAYDAAISQVQSLKAGTVQGLIAQEPRLEGIDAVKYAVDAAQGKSVPRVVETATKLLTTGSSASVLSQYEYQGNC